MSERRLLLPLMAATFAVIYSSTVIAALVTPIAAEFDVTTGTVGLITAAYAAPGVVVGIVAGPLADRFGRGWFLAAGLLVLGGLTVVAAFAPTFAWLAAVRAMAGVGAALVLPNSMATVADRFAYRERGRAVGTVFLANTTGSLAGIPVSGIVADHFGWRLSLVVAGLVALAAFAFVVAAHGRANTRRRSVSIRALYASVLRDRSALSLLGSNLLGVVTWTAWATYIVAFFQQTYGVAQGLASSYALVQGGGMLVGTQIGGRLGDRVGQKVLLCASLIAFGLVLVAVVASLPPLPVAIGGLLVAATCYGMRATSNSALMTEQVTSARATVLALSAATVSAGTVIAGVGGGAAVDAGGFIALALFCLASAALSAGLVGGLVREYTHEEPVEPATG